MPKISLYRLNNISSLDSTLISSYSLSYFLKSSKLQFLTCFLTVIFFLISLTISTKRLYIELLPDINLVLKEISYLFCFFRWDICLCSLLHSSLIYGFKEISDFSDRCENEFIFKLFYWVIIFDSLFFDIDCAISVEKVGID